MSVISNCQTRSTPNPNKNLGFPSHEGRTLLRRLWCKNGLGVVYWSSMGMCNSNNAFMSLGCKNVISNCHTRHTVNPKYDLWPSFFTSLYVVSRLRRNYGVGVIRLFLSGTALEGVLLALWACIDVRVYLRGETARAATQKLPPREHTHMAALFTNTILAFRRERQVRYYVTTPKRIASLPASRRAAPPTLGQSSWMLFSSVPLLEVKN